MICKISNNCSNRDKKANVTSKQYSNDNSNTNRKSPIVAERKKQRRESHNAGISLFSHFFFVNLY
jgi:hypothetical protein